MLAKIEAPLNAADFIKFDGSLIDFETPKVWTALIARPSKEQDAADWLKHRQLFAYWPCFVKQVRVGTGGQGGRARRASFLAVIPGYLFIAVRAGGNVDLWGITRQTPGVVGYVRDGAGRAATLTDYDIEVIRRIEGGLNLPLPKEEARKFKIGDHVRFTDDLLGNWPPGIVNAIADDGRIGVETSLLGRTVRVWAYAHQIEAM